MCRVCVCRASGTCCVVAWSPLLSPALRCCAVTSSSCTYVACYDRHAELSSTRGDMDMDMNMLIDAHRITSHIPSHRIASRHDHHMHIASHPIPSHEAISRTRHVGSYHVRQRRTRMPSRHVSCVMPLPCSHVCLDACMLIRIDRSCAGAEMATAAAHMCLGCSCCCSCCCHRHACSLAPSHE